MERNGTKKVIAVLCADLHISHRPPAARSAETDWYSVQKNYLMQLGEVAGGWPDTELPVLCAGDIFDRWDCQIETVNFALKYLPNKMYCVPGQHDLAHHARDTVHKTAYGTLLEAGKIVDLPGPIGSNPKHRFPVEVSSQGTVLRLHGFPWGCPVQPLTDPNDLCLEVAVVHAYLWNNGTGYLGAPEDARSCNVRKHWKGYDVVTYGDNHVPFGGNSNRRLPGPSVINCGGFMRRRRDEKDHRPSIGLLHSDGSVERHYLNVSGDKFVDDQEELVKGAIKGEALLDLLEELGGLADKALDFREAALRWLEKEEVPVAVRKVVLEAMDTKGGTE